MLADGLGLGSILGSSITIGRYIGRWGGTYFRMFDMAGFIVCQQVRDAPASAGFTYAYQAATIQYINTVGSHKYTVNQLT